MNSNFGNQNNIPDDEREAFIKALASYYSGVGLIRKAFDPVEPGLIDRYYRRKRHGILPEKPKSSPSSRAQDTRDRGTLMSFLGASADFASVSVATPDGRTLTATMDNPDGFFTDADDGADCDKALVVTDSPGEGM